MNTRAVAAFVLLDVVVNGQSLTRALLKATSKLSDVKDQGLLKEICYGTLRWYFQLDAIARRLLNKPLKAKDQDIRLLILIGLYQLNYLSIPAHAVLSETVEATKDLKKDWARGFVNAVLRNFQRTFQRDPQCSFHPNPRPNNVDETSEWLDPNNVENHAHPDWLVREIKSAWPQSWQAILQANNSRPPMSIRVNALKYNRASYLKKLSEHDLEASALVYSQYGITLKEPLLVDSIPEFRGGAVSVQDEAAQLAADLLQVDAGFRVLDACAAPGGKTCHILECTPDLKKLIALDIDESRLEQISENLDRLQLNDLQLAMLIQGDASDAENKWWDRKLFDRILLDAPCSATGVIRRHPDIKVLRRAEDIDNLVAVQAAMLAALWPLLKPGGKLLYATCSVLPQENHKQLQLFLHQHTDAKEDLIDADWGHRQNVGRQILPGENAMDGFYFARIEKIALK
ncbi:MAG: 16S rRNA (cytosine(967)-C(5))-methyltransferase RsmB [Gammaproteobacteria bacterium]|nr:16S rRNA (cytosine(967)-C(5))-methyltransferase RsmB [Gammaproteobacteria bacterium]